MWVKSGCNNWGRGDRLFAQREMVEKEGLLRILKDLDDKDLLERASYITFDQFVMNTIQQIQDIEVNLSSVQADYGKNHTLKLND